MPSIREVAKDKEQDYEKAFRMDQDNPISILSVDLDKKEREYARRDQRETGCGGKAGRDRTLATTASNSAIRSRTSSL